MEKNELGSLIVYLVMMALIFIVCQTVITLAIANINVGNQLLYAVICCVISVVVFTIFYEVGHIVGAKIGKYNLIYLNLFGLCLLKKEEKWKFRLSFNFEGLFSESRFAPVKGKKNNPLCFLWGGLVAFIVSVLLCFAIFMINAIPATIRYGTLIYIGIGLIILLYNIIPMKTDILNDGYRIKLLGSKENAEAYNTFMLIEDNNRKGIRTENVQPYDKISPITIFINNYVYYNYLMDDDYAGAEQIIDNILANSQNLDSRNLYRYKFQKLFFVILNKSIEEASKYYWDEMESLDRKYLEKDNYIASRRVYLLVSGIINESYSESKLAIEGMKKRINKMFDKTQAATEMKLYEMCIKKVSEKLNSEDLINLF